MATGLDTNRIQSLVIFNEITPVYSLSDDIECRFYVDPSLDTNLDKIGLYRIGWTHKQDFIVIKDVHNCTTDEFDERRLVFPISPISEDTARDDIEYQFCYFHPFGDKKSYQLCGRSESFRFSKSISNSGESGRNISPSAPEMSIRYPTLEMENLDINQTNPKRLYDLNDRDFNDLFEDEDNHRYSTPKMKRQSIDWEIEAKNQELIELKERFVQQNIVKDLEIERLTKSFRSAQRKLSSLEYELQTKIENEDKFEDIHNELMDNIRLSETKNSSLEEQLLLRDNDIKQLKAQCSSQEKTIDELRQKLAISHSELELYYTQSIESIGLDDNRSQELKQENRLLKDKLQEVMQMSEKLKETNDRLFREKRDLDKTKFKIESELESMRQNCAQLKIRLDQIEGTDSFDVRRIAEEVLVKRHTDITGNKQSEGQSHQSFNGLSTDSFNTSITIIANEMTEEVKQYCVDQTSEALNRYSDIKSMADSIVYAMDERFGNSWNCFIGRDFSHNSLLHVFGTYFSFAIKGLKIIIYKSADMPDSCQVIRWAKESPNVDILYKTEYTDNDFEDLVVNTVMDTIKEEFTDYSELSAHITKELNSNYGPKYGFNWFAICGESDRFYSNLLIFSKKYKFIELEVNCLKVIVIQFDEKIIENTNSLFNYKSFANRK